MFSVKGISEIVLVVEDVRRAAAFYQNVVGLEGGLPGRRQLVLAVGGGAGRAPAPRTDHRPAQLRR